MDKESVDSGSRMLTLCSMLQTTKYFRRLSCKSGFAVIRVNNTRACAPTSDPHMKRTRSVRLVCFAKHCSTTSGILSPGLSSCQGCQVLSGAVRGTVRPLSRPLSRSTVNTVKPLSRSLDRALTLCQGSVKPLSIDIAVKPVKTVRLSVDSLSDCQARAQSCEGVT